MSYEDYLEQLEQIADCCDERLERLHKQEAVNPNPLKVRDEATFRLLAIAGMGGSY